MSRTQPAQDYQKLTSFASDQEVNIRAAVPVGGTQFVFTTKTGATRTVLAADYETFTRYPCEIITITSDTDCDAVHIWN